MRTVPQGITTTSRSIRRPRTLPPQWAILAPLSALYPCSRAGLRGRLRGGGHAWLLGTIQDPHGPAGPPQHESGPASRSGLSWERGPLARMDNRGPSARCGQEDLPPEAFRDVRPEDLRPHGDAHLVAEAPATGSLLLLTRNMKSIVRSVLDAWVGRRAGSPCAGEIDTCMAQVESERLPGRSDRATTSSRTGRTRSSTVLRS